MGNPRRLSSSAAICAASASAIEQLESRLLLAYANTTTLGFNAPAGGISDTGFSDVLPTTKGKGLVSANITIGNGQLRLASTSGDLWQTRNNQDNALGLPLNSTKNFQVNARLTSFPFTKNYQNGGIYIGGGEDNYVKLSAGFGNGTYVSLGSEKTAVFTAAAFKAISPASFVSLDLRLTGDAATQTLTAHYRLNSDSDASWVALGSVKNVNVFGPSAKAGVVTTSYGGPVFTASYNWFTLASDYTPTVPPPPPPPPPPVSGDIVDLSFDGAAAGINATGFTTVLATSKGKGLISGNVSVNNGQLKLITTAGDLYGARNNQDNALSVVYDTTRDFTIDTRLTSFPFTRNYVNGGLLLATSEDNYIKVAASYGNGTSLVLGSEIGGSFTVPAYKLFNPSGLSTLDLRLIGTYATRTLTAQYRVNSSNDAQWVTIGSTTNASVFNATARAGLVGTNFGSTPITMTADYFKVNVGAPVVVPPPPPPPPPGNIPITIGMHLDGLAEYSVLAPFVDLATMFRPWDASVPVNANNYPLADASTVTNAYTYPDGDYQVSYAGQANLSFSGLNASYQVTGTSNGVTTGILHIEPTSHPGTLTLGVSNVNPANPLRDLHIISPDMNPAVSTTFRPVFLEKLAPFDGFLRTMDWTQTNESLVDEWSDRATLDRFSYISPIGIPYEMVARVANETDKDLWINLPVLASDDYIRKTAQLYFQLLEPGRKLYIEYSNELWAYWHHGSAIKNLEMAKLDPEITKTDPWGQSAQRAGKRLAQIAMIFKQEFGAARYDSQVRPILGGLIAGSSWGDIALQYVNDKYGDVHDYIAGLAMSYYVGVINDFAPVDNDTLTLDKLFAWSHNWIDTTLADWTKQNKAVADKWGLPMHAYEGGQAFVASNGKNEAIKVAAQTDPRMGDVYRHLVRSWTKLSGGGIFGNFATASPYTVWGYWGVLNAITQPTSVKYEAIKELVNQTV